MLLQLQSRLEHEPNAPGIASARLHRPARLLEDGQRLVRSLALSRTDNVEAMS